MVDSSASRHRVALFRPYRRRTSVRVPPGLESRNVPIFDVLQSKVITPGTGAVEAPGFTRADLSLHWRRGDEEKARLRDGSNCVLYAMRYYSSLFG